jgi:phosphate transport system permease protein
MTDISMERAGAGQKRRLDLTSDAARARIKARYRAEARFKAYGIAALAVTTLFLAVLLVDIVRQGLPTFTEHTLVLDVPVKADVVDPAGKRDIQAIKGADYFPLMKAALDTAIPGIESRGASKQLARLLSVGAPDRLRDMIVADPSLIGKTVKVPLLLSDDADIYYKGSETKVIARPGRGTATPSGVKGEITILTSSNDFAEELKSVKDKLRVRVAEMLADATRIDRAAGQQQAAKVKELRDQAGAFKLRVEQPAVAEMLDSKLPSVLVAINGGLVKVTKLDTSGITGDVLLPLKSTDEAKPQGWQVVNYPTPEADRKVLDQEVAFLERFRDIGAVDRGFNWRFFTSGDSREPELAGVRGALVGTALTLLVTLLLCLPIGVMAAIYLEEFAPKNRWTDLVEVNINNLAAVPSIVFGLLGLAVFLNFFGLPRSAPLVGGLVLALLVLPTIIIAARAALKAVPPSIKEAALGVGASHQQAVFHHVLPLAMPGIMTGTIIGMAHALGETAPLLMIGMVAFIVDVPKGLTEAATVLPVQIYLWSDLPEPAFQAKTAAAIIVLLGFLFLMNGAAIWLRKKFERRW